MFGVSAEMNSVRLGHVKTLRHLECRAMNSSARESSSLAGDSLAPSKALQPLWKTKPYPDLSFSFSYKFAYKPLIKRIRSILLCKKTTCITEIQQYIYTTILEEITGPRPGPRLAEQTWLLLLPSGGSVPLHTSAALALLFIWPLLASWVNHGEY